MVRNKAFELKLRKLIDSKYDRPANSENPFYGLIEGTLSVEQCRKLYSGFWESLMVFNRVLLPRLLEKAPNVEMRVELMGVIAQEYGPRIEEAHPMLFHRFLTELGIPKESLPAQTDIDNGPARDEVRMMRNWSFCELLARILVGESLGPVCFDAIAESLQKNYGLSEQALAYFHIHAVTDKKDAELLFDMISRQVQTEEDMAKVTKVVEDSFTWGRYGLMGCSLPKTDVYRYAPRFVGNAA